jgi:alpha-tubulin suppressor-like RCC1 family protein
VCVPGVVEPALGFTHTCVRRQTGTVQCFGDNMSGECGGSAPQVLLPLEPGQSLPDVLAGPVVHIDSGEALTCGLTPAGKVMCWGDNTNGQLGQGPNAASPGMVDLGGDYQAISLGVGQDSACAVLAGGAVKCWGHNDVGQLGLGDLVNRGDKPGQMGDNLMPVPIGAGLVARSVAVGDAHACALLDDGRVTCWGDNFWGQLGLENTTSRGTDLAPITGTEFTDLGGPQKPVALVAGGDHTCALLDDGHLKCWGANPYGQIGIEDSTEGVGDEPGEMGGNLPWVNLGTGRTAVAIGAGEFHTCALLDDGDVKCWGRGEFGQLGSNSQASKGSNTGDMGDNLAPVDLGTENGRKLTALAIGGGELHTCAVLDNHMLKCWGVNMDGQVGLADLTNNYGDGFQMPNPQTTTNNPEMGDNLPYVDLGE